MKRRCRYLAPDSGGRLSIAGLARAGGATDAWIEYRVIGASQDHGSALFTSSASKNRELKMP